MHEFDREALQFNNLTEIFCISHKILVKMYAWQPIRVFFRYLLTVLATL